LSPNDRENLLASSQSNNFPNFSFNHETINPNASQALGAEQKMEDDYEMQTGDNLDNF